MSERKTWAREEGLGRTEYTNLRVVRAHVNYNISTGQLGWDELGTSLLGTVQGNHMSDYHLTQNSTFSHSSKVQSQNPNLPISVIQQRSLNDFQTVFFFHLCS